MTLELARPHGFLLWRGKKKAIARPVGHELPVGQALTVTTNGEAFGDVTLGTPATVPVLEFDGAEWFTRHRVNVKERNAWWPKKTEFLVYPVTEFKALKQPQWLKGVPASYGPATGEQRCADCLEYENGFCRMHDQVVEDGHVCESFNNFEDWRGNGDTWGVDTDTTAQKALDEPELEDWRAGDDHHAGGRSPEPVEDGETVQKRGTLFTEQELREAVEEAETMPYEKRERDGQWCVFKEGEAEPLKCYEAEGDADDYLTALRINVEAEEAEKAEPEPTAQATKDITTTSGTGVEEPESQARAILRQAVKEALAESEAEKQALADEVTALKAELEAARTAKARGEGMGQGEEPQGDGGTDTCVCPKCGAKSEHERGTPCNETDCPECGADMTAEGSLVTGAEEKAEGTKGGPGSGHHGHAGRPGQRGGSAPGKGGGGDIPNVSSKGPVPDKYKDTYRRRYDEAYKKGLEWIRLGDRKGLRKEIDKIERGLSGRLQNIKDTEQYLDGPDAESAQMYIDTEWQSYWSSIGWIDGRRKVLADNEGKFQPGLTKLGQVTEKSTKDTPADEDQKARHLSTSTEDLEQGAKAGARLKRSMMDRIKDALETLKEVLGWAEYEDQEPEMATAPFFKFEHDAGLTVKEIDGEPWLVTYTTNAFKDRQQEMFSTGCLEQYIAEAEQKGDRGTYDFWHIPGSDFAEVKLQMMAGRFLVEAGPFLNTDVGQRARKFFTQHPDGHPKLAPEGWGCSPEFRYLPEERKSGTYDWIWIVRRAVLPRAAAANVWTHGNVEVVTMATKQQRDAFAAVVGDETADQIIADGEERTKQLEEAGVAHKAESETAVEETVGEAAEEAQAEETPADEGQEAEEKQAQAPEIDLKSLAEEVARLFEVQLEPLAEVAEAVKALNGRMAALEEQKAMASEVEMPRFTLSLQKQRASQAAETQVDVDDPLLKMKPKETKPNKDNVSGAANFFGSG